MQTYLTDDNSATHRILLKADSSAYALDLSHLVTSESSGDIELKLSPPSHQKLVFQTAEDYNISLEYQSGLGVYKMTGDAKNMANFLAIVEMIPNSNAIHNALIITSTIKDVSSGQSIVYKLLIAKDDVSGDIKTMLKQDSAGNGVSQVAQIGSVFLSDNSLSELYDINFSLFDLKELKALEPISAVTEEKEIFGDATIIPVVIGNTAPSFLSTGLDAAEQSTLYNYLISATDINGDALTIGSSTLPAWLTLLDNGDGTASLSGTPSSGDRGFGNDVVLTLSDGTATVTQSFDIFATDVGLLGTAAGDSIIDGTANRFIHGFDGDDTIDAGSGLDVVNGGRGNDIINGGFQNDLIFGADDNDTLDGGGNNDTLDGGSGVDSLTGGTGEDVFNFSDFTESTVTNSDIVTDYTVDDDYVIFTDTTITGIGAGANQITISNNGSQTFLDHNSSSFRATLDGVYSASDLDLLFGDIINGTTGEDTILGGNLGNVISSGSGRDSVDSGNGDDAIYLGAASDTLNAGAGDDTADGASQEDIMNGEAGNDSLIGGSGNDTINGGADADTLSGDNDDDVFIVADLTHSTTTASDLIEDYTIDDDYILLSDAGLTGIGAGASEVTITDNGSQTFIDHNSSSFRVTLDGVYTTSNLDLLFGDIFYGTTATDSIVGTAFGDVFKGLDNNDTIESQDEDSILGGAGDDTIDGGDDSDTIDGGEGKDIIIGGGSNDSLIGFRGDDTISGDAGNDTIFGNADHDSLDGGNGNDIINGGDNSDVINGEAGQDSLTGGAGADVFRFTNLTHSTNTSSDVIQDYVIDEDIIFLDGISITGIGAAANELTLTDNGSQTFLDHNTSTFRITLDGVYTASDITIASSNFFYGVGAANNITGTSGDDFIYGNDWHDTLDGAGGNDYIDGGNQDDDINGGSGNDTLFGGDFHDEISGDSGDDNIDGGSFEDLLNGGAGEDTITGGSENDIFRFTSLTDSTNTASDLITDYEANLDWLFLDGLGITGIGAGGSELTLTDDGTQTFLDHNSSSFQITFDGVYTAGDFRFVSGNFISGSRNADTLTGTGGNDFIIGNYGADSIDGGAGNDTLYGGRDNDTLYGGSGDDSINGGRSDEFIDGGVGNDTLTGYNGDDTFIFTESTAGNEDNITDFTKTGDNIDTFALSDSAFTFNSGDGTKDGVTLTDNVDIFDVGTDFTSGSFATGGNITFLFDTTDNQLWYDADGSAGGGNAVLIFTLNNTYLYDANDFEGWA